MTNLPHNTSDLKAFANPFKPGAGHTPPYLAGRSKEHLEFKKLLNQTIILDNLILTGLRGVGKTVLLETFKPLAIQHGWLWVGTDLTEAASLTDENLAIRILADMSLVTSTVTLQTPMKPGVGFTAGANVEHTPINFDYLRQYYLSIPGLTSDKLKQTLEFAWAMLKKGHPHIKGLIFAYDEAQNLSDHSASNQFPMSLLLDVFQSIQKKKVPFMLALTGLPTLFQKLVEARTYAERMFHCITLARLSDDESRDAIVKPIENCLIVFTTGAVEKIIIYSGGYPYFIQFLCREMYDTYLARAQLREDSPDVSLEEICRKLDTDFFSGRWNRLSDRQRELLIIIAMSGNSSVEFSVNEITKCPVKDIKPFSNSHINQMLSNLVDLGFIFKNRHGKYSFAVPMMDGFIRRRYEETTASD